MPCRYGDRRDSVRLWCRFDRWRFAPPHQGSVNYVQFLPIGNVNIREPAVHAAEDTSRRTADKRVPDVPLGQAGVSEPPRENGVVLESETSTLCGRPGSPPRPRGGRRMTCAKRWFRERSPGATLAAGYATPGNATRYQADYVMAFMWHPAVREDG